jgi:GNAT superfamily N-acetyltransferase
VRVCQIDPGDEAAFDAWFAVLQATDAERWGDPDGGLSRREVHVAASRRGAVEYRCLSAIDAAGSTVGIALCEVPQRDNRHGASLDIRVASAYRRRGVGSLILAEAERVLAADGRTVVSALVEVPPAAAATDPSAPFARRHGFEATQTGNRRNLALPVDPGRLARLHTVVAQAAGDYVVHTFGAPWPEEYLDDQCELKRRRSTDEPSGDARREEQAWDAARIKESEAFMAAQGKVIVVAVAQQVGSGRLVAFSELAAAVDAGVT